MINYDYLVECIKNSIDLSDEDVKKCNRMLSMIIGYYNWWKILFDKIYNSFNWSRPQYRVEAYRLCKLCKVNDKVLFDCLYSYWVLWEWKNDTRFYIDNSYYNLWECFFDFVTTCGDIIYLEKALSIVSSANSSNWTLLKNMLIQQIESIKKNQTDNQFNW